MVVVAQRTFIYEHNEGRSTSLQAPHNGCKRTSCFNLDDPVFEATNQSTGPRDPRGRLRGGYDDRTIPLTLSSISKQSTLNNGNHELGEDMKLFRDGYHSCYRVECWLFTQPKSFSRRLLSRGRKPTFLPHESWTLADRFINSVTSCYVSLHRTFDESYGLYGPRPLV